MESRDEREPRQVPKRTYTEYLYQTKNKCISRTDGVTGHRLESKDDARLHVSWPDPLNAKSWATPLTPENIKALNLEIDVPLEKIMRKGPDYLVAVAKRSEVVEHMLNVPDPPRFRMYGITDWVIKEYNIGRPGMHMDPGYVSVRTQALISCFSGDTQGMRRAKHVDKYPALTRGVCPLYRYWRTIEIGKDGSPAVHMYMAMPKASGTLMSFLQHTFVASSFVTPGTCARAMSKTYNACAQILVGLCNLQSPALRMSHCDLHTENILFWDRDSDYYKTNAPGSIQYSHAPIVDDDEDDDHRNDDAKQKQRNARNRDKGQGKHKPKPTYPDDKEDVLVTVPIRDKLMPWFWIYDFDRSQSDRWSGMTPHLMWDETLRLPERNTFKYHDQRDHIRPFEDVVRVFSEIRVEIAECLWDIFDAHPTLLDPHTHALTRLDKTLFELTRGFAHSYMEGHATTRMADDKKAHYMMAGSTFDLQAAERPIIRGDRSLPELLMSIGPVETLRRFVSGGNGARFAGNAHETKDTVILESGDTDVYKYLEPDKNDALFVSPDDLRPPRVEGKMTHMRPFYATVRSPKIKDHGPEPHY